MPPIPCLFVPRLHAELAPSEAHGARICKPWLAQGEADDATPLVNLPLRDRTAEAALREWRGMAPDVLQQEVTRVARARFDEDGGLFPGEIQELHKFQGKKPSNAGSRLVLAQRLLLLAWVQEERVLAIRELHARYMHGAERLSRLLGEGSGGFPQETSPERAGEEELLPSWRFVMRAMRPFLPEHAAFFVAEPEMAEALERLCPAGVIDDEAKRQLPASLAMRPGLRGRRVSLGALLGDASTSPDPERLFLTEA